VVIAQCIAAGHRTVDPAFAIHSCHCYFLQAGTSSAPILYHVERLRDGRSYVARTVQARQKGKCIFTVTMSFVRDNNGGEKTLRHAVPIPEGKLEEVPVDPPRVNDNVLDNGKPGEPSSPEDEDDELSTSPWVVSGARVTSSPSIPDRKVQQWIRARGTISSPYLPHVEALAYMSDSYFLFTIGRIHDIWRVPRLLPSQVGSLPRATQRKMRRAFEAERGIGAPLDDVAYWEGRPHLGMTVSLDHTIYFHEPRRIRADAWMFCEMESPWAADGRGLVVQRIFAGDGTLLATCVQEGVMRLRQDVDTGEEREGDGEAKAKL
jgi:acyl-CoA thioesterase 8